MVSNFACTPAYYVPKLTVTTVVIQAYNDTALQTCTKEITSITSLTGKAVRKIDVIGPDAPRPAGCVAYSVSTAAAVFLHVKGRVDMDAEIAKAQKRVDKANQNIQRQEKLLADASYKEKASEAVRESDEKKLADSKQEVINYEATIKQFEQLKLE